MENDKKIDDDDFDNINDFAPWKSQEEKDTQISIMSEYYNYEIKQEEENQRNTNIILKELEKIKPTNWFNDLIEYSKESQTHNPFSIVKKPKGDWQEENDYKTLGGVWVDQKGGYPIEDSFYGTVTVKIDKNRYLEMPYST